MPTDNIVEARIESKAVRKLRRQVEAKESSLVKTKRLLGNAEKNIRIMKRTMCEYEQVITAYKNAEAGRWELNEKYNHLLDQNFKMQERITELNQKLNKMEKQNG